MSFIIKFFSLDNYVYQVEALTIIAVVVVLGYFFYLFNVFKKG